MDVVKSNVLRRNPSRVDRAGSDGNGNGSKKSRQVARALSYYLSILIRSLQSRQFLILVLPSHFGVSECGRSSEVRLTGSDLSTSTIN